MIERRVQKNIKSLKAIFSYLMRKETTAAAAAALKIASEQQSSSLPFFKSALLLWMPSIKAGSFGCSRQVSQQELPVRNCC